MKKETIYLILFLIAIGFAIGYVIKLIKEADNAIAASKL